MKDLKKEIPLDEAIALLKKLIAIPTVNPPGNERALEPVVRPAMESLGMRVQVIEKERGRANFIGKIGKGSPSVGIFVHLDTVPAGDGWKTDPFKAVVQNGKLYGRGATDDKGSFATSWVAIKTFLSRNPNFDGTLYLIGAADEEMGSDCGVQFLLKKGFRVDYAIVPDGGYIDKIEIGEKGVLRLKVISRGKQAHGSLPEEGINAITNLSEFLTLLKDLKFDDLQHHPLFRGVTVNVGKISGGHAVNIVPATAEAEIDIRIPYGVTKKQVLDKFKGLIQVQKSKNKSAKISIEEGFFVPPHLTDKKSDIVQKFLKSAKELGVKMRVDTMGGVTDSKPLSLAGVQTVVHDLDDGSDVAHAANEFVVLKNIPIAAALYVLTLEKLFGK